MYRACVVGVPGTLAAEPSLSQWCTQLSYLSVQFSSNACGHTLGLYPRSKDTLDIDIYHGRRHRPPHVRSSAPQGEDASFSIRRACRTHSGCPAGRAFSRRSRRYIMLRHRPGGTWGRARRLAAVTGGPGAAVVAGVATGGLGCFGGVGYCGRLGTLRNGSRPRAAAGAAAGGGAKRSIRAWSGAGPG